MTDEVDRIAVQIPCSYCHVPSGSWCRTKSGNIAYWLHGVRVQPVYDLWSSAYQQGEREGIDYAQRFATDPERITRYVQSLDRWLAGEAS